MTSYSQHQCTILSALERRRFHKTDYLITISTDDKTRSLVRQFLLKYLHTLSFLAQNSNLFGLIITYHNFDTFSKLSNDIEELSVSSVLDI